MSFTNFDFLFFIPIIASLYYLTPYSKRWIVLLFGSYFFYLSFKLEFIPWIILMTVSVYLLGLLIQKFRSRKANKYFLLFGIFFIVFILIIFKYNSFLFANVNYLLSFFKINIKQIEIGFTTPLGISYFSFVMISYLIDVYNEKINAEHHLGKFAVYIAFFPKLIAGPIERAKDFISQLSVNTDVKYENISTGVKLILLGFFKKAVIADRLSEAVNKLYGGIADYSWISVLFVVFLYSFQLYADFSGYTDMARGVAKLMGINLTENFKRPYLASSISELWRRWHISLSNWLRDYIFLPISYSISRKMIKKSSGINHNSEDRKNKFSKSKPLKIFSPEYIAYMTGIFITMAICGIWHGASWNFVIWGSIQGILLIIAFLYRRNKKKIYRNISINKSFRLISSVIFTFIFFSISLVFFRADTLGDAVLIFRKLVSMDNGIFITLLFKNNLDLIITILLLVVLIAVEIFLEIREKKGKQYELYKFINIPVAIIILLCIFVFGKFAQTDFLYFKF